MYYSKKSSVNSDYYNAYGYSNQEDDKQSTLNTIIKILAVILLLTFIIFGYIFILKEQKSEQVIVNNSPTLPKITTESNISEPSARSASLSNQEILQIVEIVMSQMNQPPKHKPAVTQALVVEGDDDGYAKALMNQEVDDLQSSSNGGDIHDVNSKKIVEKTLSLQESNHYNKVVIDKNSSQKKEGLDYLTQLSDALQQETSKVTVAPSVTYYTQSISKELDVRSNEMRMVVVKRGDTLSRIAYRAYGDYDAYPKILRANPEVISNPDQIFVGQRLRIPQ